MKQNKQNKTKTDWIKQAILDSTEGSKNVSEASTKNQLVLVVLFTDGTNKL